MVEVSLRIRLPPNHSNTAISPVPKNSDTGCANTYLRLIRLNVWRVRLLRFKKLSDNCCSALNAFTTRKPPSVSSISDKRSAVSSCPRVERRLRERPILPISKPAIGKSKSTNSVSCHEMQNSVIK